MEDRTIPEKKVDFSPDPSGEKVPYLVVLDGDSRGDVFRIMSNSVTVGRNASADVFIKYDDISKEHLRIDHHQGSFTITDLNSLNGTQLNGQNISQANLKNGDLIRIGETILRFRIDDGQRVLEQENRRTRAVRDELTDIANKEFFIETLRRDYQYAVRQRQNLTCILIEVINLEGIENKHGQKAVEKTLRQVSSVLLKDLRSYDLLARYDGGEFSILLRDTALDNALLFAKRIYVQVEKSVLEHQGDTIQIQPCLGIATLDPDYPKGSEDLFRQAERYLFEAKQNENRRIVSIRNFES